MLVMIWLLSLRNPRAYDNPAIRRGICPLLAKRRNAERSGARKSQQEKRQARAKRAKKPGNAQQNVASARHDPGVIHEDWAGTQRFGQPDGRKS
jgi:hypothetical protein